MKILFISGAASNNILDGFTKKYSNNKSQRYVQQWWDYSFATGLSKHLGENLSLLSFPAISTYPADHCIAYRGGLIDDENGLSIRMLPLINLPIVKQIVLMICVFHRIIQFSVNNKNEQTIILTHCIYPQSAIPAFVARFFVKNIKVCTIVPDLPEHGCGVPLSGNSLLSALFRIHKNLSVNIQKKFDAYICFARPQMKHLNQSSPYTIMEGFVDLSLFDDLTGIKAADKFIVLYAGGLVERYGINNLVDGFIKANIPNAELHCYGQGDAENYIKGKECYGVYLKGCVSRNEVIAKEKEASLLINPRPSNDEFSQCSFPSKLMEYLALGVPVLTTHLKCIEKEYDSLFNYIENENADGIAERLVFCHNNIEILKQKAGEATEYVRKNKNVQAQAEKVIYFLNGIK